MKITKVEKEPYMEVGITFYKDVKVTTTGNELWLEMDNGDEFHIKELDNTLSIMKKSKDGNDAEFQIETESVSHFTLK